MMTINGKISADRALGPQFRVGHSYVTPTDPLDEPVGWFRDVIDTEIGPLQERYWFDAAKRAAETMARLGNGL